MMSVRERGFKANNDEVENGDTQLWLTTKKQVRDCYSKVVVVV